MDNVRKETHVVSVMTDYPLETVAVVRDEKDDCPLPHQIRRPRLTANQATEMKALQTKAAKFRADTEIVIIRHVAIGILPYVKTKCLRLEAFFSQMLRTCF